MILNMEVRKRRNDVVRLKMIPINVETQEKRKKVVDTVTLAENALTTIIS